MGVYINPPSGLTEEQWLEENARKLDPDIDKSEVRNQVRNGEMIVALVDTGFHTAAGVAYNGVEMIEFTRPSDTRPITYFAAKVEDLLLVSNLEDRKKDWDNG